MTRMLLDPRIAEKGTGKERGNIMTVVNEQISITSGYVAGTLGRVTELHGTYYAKHWDLPLYFEAKVATEMAEFLKRFDPAHDGLWLARVHEQTIGAIFIDGSDAAGQGARLRWFVLEPAYHGRGVGRRLMDAAMAFCRAKGFSKVYLTTFAGLDAARHLYDKAGFKVTHEEHGEQLAGRALTEQRLELVLT
jgi:GNAT superfamily N-acetyltransferase